MEYRLRYRFAHLTQISSTGFNGVFDSNSDYTAYIEEPDKITFSFGKSDGNNEDQLDSTGIDKGVSSTMTIFGKGYEYVRNWLIDHSDASINSIQVEIYDMLCGKSMGIWEMKADNLQWCDNDICEIRVNLTEYTPVGNCLKNTLITDDWRGWFPDDGTPKNHYDEVTGMNNPDYIHPNFRYCIDIKPQAVQNFVFVIAHTLSFAFGAIIAIVGTMLTAIGLGETFGEWADEKIGDIFETLLGCNRKHPAPFVRNYFINACGKCKVSFESNIFNDPTSEHSRYYNTAHLFAPSRVGYIEKDIDDDKKNWIPSNAPYETVVSYAYSLKDLFNAKFKLENGVFSFHRKDNFPVTMVFDFTGEDKNLLLQGICYGWNAQKKPAAITLEYAQDVKDVAGDEAIQRFNGQKDWVTDNPFYEGITTIKTDSYSSSRFTTDGIDRKLAFANLDDEDFWEDGIMLIEKGVTQLGKLLIWDGVSTYKEAKVIKVNAETHYDLKWQDEWLFGQSPPSVTYWVFNYPLFFDWQTNEGVSNGYTLPINKTHKNLFELHKIDDPTASGLQNKSWSCTLELCCSTLYKLIQNDTSQDGIFCHLDYLVQLTATEKGTITRVEVDYDQCEIRISGEIKYTT